MLMMLDVMVGEVKLMAVEVKVMAVVVKVMAKLEGREDEAADRI